MANTGKNKWNPKKHAEAYSTACTRTINGCIHIKSYVHSAIKGAKWWGKDFTRIAETAFDMLEKLDKDYSGFLETVETALRDEKIKRINKLQSFDTESNENFYNFYDEFGFQMNFQAQSIDKNIEVIRKNIGGNQYIFKYMNNSLVGLRKVRPYYGSTSQPVREYKYINFEYMFCRQ